MKAYKKRFVYSAKKDIMRLYWRGLWRGAIVEWKIQAYIHTYVHSLLAWITNTGKKYAYIQSGGAFLGMVLLGVSGKIVCPQSTWSFKPGFTHVREI